MDKKSNANKFITLLENDFYRSLKVMIPVIIIFILAHLGAAFMCISGFKDNMLNLLAQNKNIGEVAYWNKFSIYNILIDSIVLPIMVASFVVITLYTVVLWNREWRGSSKSIYTLLILPFKRANVILSKVCVILIFLGLNLTLQVSTLFLDKGLISLMLDQKYICNLSILSCFTGNYRIRYLSLNPINVTLNALLALSIVLLLSLWVLLFRSFKIKGVLSGLIIFGAYLGAFIFIPRYLNLYLFEGVSFKIILSLISSSLTFMGCKYLLNNKVTV